MIALYMNRRDYENDIRSLLMAFFYGDKIVLNAKEWDVCLDVRYTENYTSLSLKDNKGQCLEKEGNCHFEDYRLGRNDIKNLVYHILSEYTGMTLPWAKLPEHRAASGIERNDNKSLCNAIHTGRQADGIFSLGDPGSKSGWSG